jgi:hypothetical protein
VRTGGYINLRLRSADGTIQRELQTTIVPVVGENIYTYYSWNATTKVLCMKVVSDSNDYGSLTTSATASLIAFTGETSGVYFGNSESGVYPYKGKMYGGTFVIGKALTMAELEDIATNKMLVPGLTFQCFPKYYGIEGSTTVRENHGHDLTVSVADLTTFWAGLTPGKITPSIRWSNPADIDEGTALSSTQLNATASVAGSFVYTPLSGSVLEVGDSQALRVDFTPTNTAAYNSTYKIVYINVKSVAAEQVFYVKSTVYGGSDKAACILVSPTSNNVTFNTIKMQMGTLAETFQNYPTGVALLTDNLNGTYSIAQWLYKAEQGYGLSKATTGRYIDGTEVFDVTATYNVSKVLNSWNHVFTAGNKYLVVMSDAYVDLKLGSGSAVALVGLSSWQIYSLVTGIVMTPSPTYALFAEIS